MIEKYTNKRYLNNEGAQLRSNGLRISIHIMLVAAAPHIVQTLFLCYSLELPPISTILFTDPIHNPAFKNNCPLTLMGMFRSFDIF